MKKNLFLLLAFFCLISCSSDNDVQEISHSYYVKYEVATPILAYGIGDNTITYTNEKGSQTLTTKNYGWEQTIGPVKKGFLAQLTTTTSVQGALYNVHAKIYVSRDNEPFVLKEEGTGKASTAISHTIE